MRDRADCHTLVVTQLTERAFLSEIGRIIDRQVEIAWGRSLTCRGIWQVSDLPHERYFPDISKEALHEHSTLASLSLAGMCGSDRRDPCRFEPSAGSGAENGQACGRGH